MLPQSTLDQGRATSEDAMFVIPAFLLAISAAPAVPRPELTSADRAAAYRAAGFKRVGGQWRSCDAPEGSVYTPGEIEQVRDLNGDGRPDAIITEGSSFCYGSDEVGFAIVSKQADATWKRITVSPGIPTVLKTRGTAGWPDIEVAGQGFCFPVQRWDGSEYRPVRFQYEGKACQPPR
jgi:hypothetical protein